MADAVPGPILDKLFPYASGLGAAGIRRFGQYVRDLDDPARAYLAIVSLFDLEERRELLGEASPIHDEIAHHFANKDLLDGLLSVETKVQLPDNLLMKVDKMTMAASIEARTPLLGEDVASFVRRLPHEYKRHKGADKYVFRRAMRDVLPEEIFQREKQRFFVPIHEWLTGSVGEYAWDHVETGVRRGHFDRRAVEAIRRKYDQSPIYYARQLWCMLTFELWYDEFIAPAQ